MVPNEGLGELNKWSGRANHRKIYCTKVVEHVFKHEKDGHLQEHGRGHLVCLHTKRFSHGMEQPDLKALFSAFAWSELQWD